VIAVDTNILIYAHREDSPWHDAASKVLTQLAQGAAPWAVPWPCLHEFLAIVTHPRIFAPPTPLPLAIDQIQAWLESPSVFLLSETEGYWAELRTILETGRIVGPQIHDARIAAICRLYGIRELWTADRDFSRFPGVHVRNPLVSR
jgi:toxin-antitoxin system PIN domain toxin